MQHPAYADRRGKADTLVDLQLIPAPRVNPAAHIAVLDDEVDITQLLANYLRGQGFRVTPVHSGRSLMALMPVDPPALVLLDLGLPGDDGFVIARQLREHWRCGLVIVTGRGVAVDKVVGLEVGADDYVTKPFDLRELLARIKAVLRRMLPANLPQGLPTDRTSTGPAPSPCKRPTPWRVSCALRVGSLTPPRAA